LQLLIAASSANVSAVPTDKIAVRTASYILQGVLLERLSGFGIEARDLSAYGSPD
jgi:hypothetical protein